MSKSIPVEIGDRVRSIRAGKRMTQQDMAEQLSITLVHTRRLNAVKQTPQLPGFIKLLVS